MKKSFFISLMIVLFSAPSFAYEKGEIVAKFGFAHVKPNGDGALDGALDVESDTQIGLTLTYMLSDNLGLGLLAATPFSHDITVSGDKVGEVSHLPPTFTLQYHFNNSSDIKPYVGAGLNYTIFFEEESVLGDLALDSSVGLALEAGVDFAIHQNWGVNVSVWNIDIDSDAELDGAELDTVEIDPWVFMIGAAYTF
ncbi:MAG: outer membrane beta-barrel protein [Agarilytica sp.]